MAASLAAIVAMLPVALDRTAPASGGSGETAGTERSGSITAPSAPVEPSDETSSAEAEDVSGVVVIGDSDTRGTGRGVVAWPALVEDGLSDIQIEAVTTGDSGYVSTTAGEPTLTELVSRTDLTDAELVVLFGSRFDASGISDRVSAAAEEAVATVRDRAPGTALVVIGPLWPEGTPPAGVRNNRDVLRAAADAAGVTFVDPLTEGWLAVGTGLVDEDDVHLTGEGQTALAGLVQPVIEQALDEAVSTTSGG